MSKSIRFSGGHRPKKINPLDVNPPTHFSPGSNKLISPEEKAAASRGQVLTGKINLDQYHLLIKRGYDGDKIKNWTAHHAGKVIRANSLADNPRYWLDLAVASLRNSESLKSDSSPKGPMRKCPYCGDPVRDKKFKIHKLYKCPKRPLDEGVSNG